MRTSMLLVPAVAAGLMFLLAPSASAQMTCPGNGSAPAVWTSQYSNARNGVNPCETQLSGTTFFTSGTAMGLKYSLATPCYWGQNGLCASQNQNNHSGTDSPVYAEALYLPHVWIVQDWQDGFEEAGYSNVVIVATLDDYVFAFDADTGDELWLNSCPSGGCTSANLAGVSLYNDRGDCTGTKATNGSRLQGLMTGVGTSLSYAGVVSTPVVDTTNGIVYVVGACRTSEEEVQWMLHGLYLATGGDASTPVNVGGSSNTIYVPSNAPNAGTGATGHVYVPTFDSGVVVYDNWS